MTTHYDTFRSALSAWCAAAGTAGAYVPQKIHEVFTEELDRRDAQWADSSYPGEGLGQEDALRLISEAHRCAFGDSGDGPLPRGMEVGLDCGGGLSLIWTSDSHVITLHLRGCVLGLSPYGWLLDEPGGNAFRGLDLQRPRLTIEGPDHSDRRAAATAAWADWEVAL